MYNNYNRARHCLMEEAYTNNCFGMASYCYNSYMPLNAYAGSYKLQTYHTLLIFKCGLA